MQPIYIHHSTSTCCVLQRIAHVMLKALLGFMSCVSGYAATPTFTKAPCFNGPQPHHLFGSS